MKKKLEDMDEIFKSNRPETIVESSKEIKLSDDDEESTIKPTNGHDAGGEKPPASPSNINIQPMSTSTSAAILSAQASTVTKKATATLEQLNKFYDDDDDGAGDETDEEKDSFINIVLSDPSKVGEGMSSYMVYKVTTKTNVKAFKSQEFATNRRFSDFLNLFEKLKEKHLPAGRILPPAPEKDMIGMAKVKMSKEDATPIDFIEKRRAALERFLNRLAKHKTFKYDPDFRDFLEISGDLPKASNTSALSGAGMLKMFKNVTDSVSKMAVGKMDEKDQWFDEKLHQIENLYIQYKKLHSTVEVLYGWRKGLES